MQLSLSYLVLWLCDHLMQWRTTWFNSCWCQMSDAILSPRYEKYYPGRSGSRRPFAANGWLTAPPIDVVLDAAFKLLNPLFMAIVLAIICEGPYTPTALGPSVLVLFPIALNSARASAVRSVERPSGLPGIPPYMWENVRLGNALADDLQLLHARV